MKYCVYVKDPGVSPGITRASLSFEIQTSESENLFFLEGQGISFTFTF